MRVLASTFLTASLLIGVLTEPMTKVDGQSGRQAPRPPAEPGKSEPVFVPDPNRDEYQILFGTIPEAEKLKDTLKTWERWEYPAAPFSADLSRIGAQGYRLVSFALWPRVAVLRRAEHQYEYVLLQISSRRNMFPNDPELALTYEPWARKGFRIADYIVINDWCDVSMWDVRSNEFSITSDCTYFSQMVLERRKDVTTSPHRYEIVSARPTFSKDKLESGLSEQLDSTKKLKLYPTHLLTKFQLLTQPAGDADFPAGEYEMEVVSEDVKKRVNALAQQGYRLLLRPIWFQAAVMHRKKGATEPASYIWIDEKKLEQELTTLQDQGAIYRMNNGCTWGTQMIFEQPSARENRRREYKVVAIELIQIKGTLKDKYHFEIATGSYDRVQEFKRLTKEGFEVRDFFACQFSDNKDKTSRVKLLLERVSN